MQFAKLSFFSDDLMLVHANAFSKDFDGILMVCAAQHIVTRSYGLAAR